MRKFEFLRGLMAAAATLLALSGCGGGGDGAGLTEINPNIAVSPPTLDLAPGAVSSLRVTGGYPPFRVASSNPEAVHVLDPTTSTTFKIQTGYSVAGSSATITVTDSKGQVATSAIRVVTVALGVAPSSVTLRADSTFSLHPYGGVPPYKITSTKPGAIRINGADYASVGAGVAVTISAVTAVDIPDGAVQVTDAAGAMVSTTVNVTKKPVPFKTVTLVPITESAAPATGTTAIAAGASALVSVQMAPEFTGNLRSLTLRRVSGDFVFHPDYAPAADGSIQIKTDSAGTAAAVLTVASTAISGFGTLTVQDVADGGTADVRFIIAGAKLSVTPDTFTAVSAGSACGGSSANFVVSGGRAPYRVQSTNPAVVTVTPATLEKNGDSFAATAGSTCTDTGAEILITDASNTTIKALFINKSGATAGTLAISPATSTIAPGQVATFTFVGGTAPYTVTSSNASVATVSPTTVPSAGGTAAATALSVGIVTLSVVDAQGRMATAQLTVQ